MTADLAREQARTAEREIEAGRYKGPLHGIPVAVKDLFATKGILTTAGSRILNSWIPDEDATVVRKLREAGAVLLGKLGLHEFAYGVSSVNPHFGDVHNPLGHDEDPGGSSGDPPWQSSPARRTPRWGATPEDHRIPASLRLRRPQADIRERRVSRGPFRSRGPRSSGPARTHGARRRADDGRDRGA